MTQERETGRPNGESIDLDRVLALYASADMAQRDGVDVPALADRIIRTATTKPQVVSRGGLRPWQVGIRWGVTGAAVIVAGVALWRLGATGPKSQAVREFSTRPASFATLTLRDGTQVTLGPASHLSVPADFGRSTRRVDLDGEALFTVVHDPVHPFTVQTASAVTRDVGTRFAIRGYREETVTHVVVAEGSVDIAVAHDTQGAVTRLKAGDAATIDMDGHATFAHYVAIGDELAWSEGRIILRSVSLIEAVRELSRAYGVDIRVADTALGSQRVTVTADVKRDRVDDVVKLLSLSLGARMIDRDGTIVLIPHQH